LLNKFFSSIFFFLFFFVLINAETLKAQNYFYVHFNSNARLNRDEMKNLCENLGGQNISFPFEKCRFAKLGNIAGMQSNKTNEELNRYLLDYSSITNIQKKVEHSYFYEPNDPAFSPTQQWNLFKISASDAWDIDRGWEGIKIGIVDDGVDVNHPDLTENIYRNAAEIPNNGMDDDENGYIDDFLGFDASNNTGNPLPPNSSFYHGTHVAGIAAAKTNNYTGIASIGFLCNIIAVKASNNTSSVSHGIEGVVYAVEAGSKIINISWGSTDEDFTLKTIIDSARINKGVIFVAAAGNFNDSTKVYPAANQGVISVSASQQDDTKLTSSTYGSWIDLAAPGASILSTLPFNTYGQRSGTSESAPLVSGVCGLLISANPYMSTEEVKTCLVNSADPLPESESIYNVKGRLNARAALDCAKALKTNELKKLSKCFVVNQSSQTIEIFCQDILDTEAYLFSAEGKAIKTNFNKTNNSIIFEISELSSGIYFINFPGIKSLKFFKG
jgi:subtilisin family serine protease